MMHANQRWPFQKPNNNGYGVEDDDDEDTATVLDDENFGDFGGGDPTMAGRRYLTVQPKQWCTSYVANRHYVSIRYNTFVPKKPCGFLRELID